MNNDEPSILEAEPLPARPPGLRRFGTWRARAAICYVGVLALGFASTLLALAIHAAGSELHSHILLIPFITGYLIYIQRDQLPKQHTSSLGWGLMAAVMGVAALAVATLPGLLTGPFSHNDYLALMTLAFLCLLVAGGFFFLGGRWMAAVAFPVAFLLFMIPMPDRMEAALETASKLGSAETTHFFFSIYGMPFLRDGLIFQLPGIALEVAQECSGIRSSWVLFITSLLAANLFLRTTWRRTVLVLFVIPLGLLRNGLRILVIGILCVEIGPEMIHGMIHRRGGPLFFGLSLIPLFALLWWLRRGEQARRQPKSPASAMPVEAEPNKT